MRSYILLILFCCVGAQASSIRIVGEESADGLLIEFVMPAVSFSVSASGQQELALEGTVPRLWGPGLL